MYECLNYSVQIRMEYMLFHMSFFLIQSEAKEIHKYISASDFSATQTSFSFSGSRT